MVDLLQANGACVHLANPQGLNWGQRRVRNDERDAVDLADMLRLGRLPEAWIAPPATRELRELVRYRAKLPPSASGARLRRSVSIEMRQVALGDETEPRDRSAGVRLPACP